jgi:hypothetical protein
MASDNRETIEEYGLLCCNTLLGNSPTFRSNILPPTPGLLINREDGDDTFLRNVGFSPNYKLLQPTRPCCEDRKPNRARRFTHRHVVLTAASPCCALSLHCAITIPRSSITILLYSKRHKLQRMRLMFLDCTAVTGRTEAGSHFS